MLTLGCGSNAPQQAVQPPVTPPIVQPPPIANTPSSAGVSGVAADSQRPESPPLTVEAVPVVPPSVQRVNSGDLVKAYDQASFLKNFRNPPPNPPISRKHVWEPSEPDVAVTAVALAGDVSRAAVAYSNGSVIVYDVKSGEKVSELPESLKGPCPSLAMSSDGMYVLLGGSAQRGGLVIKADSGEQVFVHNAPQSDIQKGSSGNLVGK